MRLSWQWVSRVPSPGLWERIVLYKVTDFRRSLTLPSSGWLGIACGIFLPEYKASHSRIYRFLGYRISIFYYCVNRYLNFGSNSNFFYSAITSWGGFCTHFKRYDGYSFCLFMLWKNNLLWGDKSSLGAVLMMNSAHVQHKLSRDWI
jgi:hypothetical protein